MTPEKVAGDRARLIKEHFPDLLYSLLPVAGISPIAATNTLVANQQKQQKK